ncbi:MAG: DUF4260 family protein [Acidimicrobiia bacterium]
MVVVVVRSPLPGTRRVDGWLPPQPRPRRHGLQHRPYVFWAGLLLGWYLLGGPLSALATGSIWLAHIGCDRLLGYGLKFPNAFTHTHLGLTGRARGT